MQVVDSLDLGGAERVAVNLANALASRGYRSILCTTRRSGPLQKELAADVIQVHLNRPGRFAVRPLIRFFHLLSEHQVDLVHAHGTALFASVIAAGLGRKPVVWHDHFGAHGSQIRRTKVYRPAVRRAAAVIAVTPELAAWTRESLGVSQERIHYIPNFISSRSDGIEPTPGLPGRTGARVVCVAAFRPQKDHRTLLKAHARVLESVPDAHLILIGEGDPAIMGQTRRSVSALGLEERVSFLGGQENIMAILDGCDVGVLSSVSEGFPLVLLEFGHSHLATVATAVGASAEILDQGRAGLLVPPSDPQVLADAVLGLLRDRGLRAELGEHLYERVTTRYSEEQIVDRIIEAVYEPVLRNLPGTQP